MRGNWLFTIWTLGTHFLLSETDFLLSWTAFVHFGCEVFFCLRFIRKCSSDILEHLWNLANVKLVTIEKRCRILNFLVPSYLIQRKRIPKSVWDWVGRRFGIQNYRVRFAARVMFEALTKFYTKYTISPSIHWNAKKTAAVLLQRNKTHIPIIFPPATWVWRNRGITRGHMLWIQTAA